MIENRKRFQTRREYIDANDYSNNKAPNMNKKRERDERRCVIILLGFLAICVAALAIVTWKNGIHDWMIQDDTLYDIAEIKRLIKAQNIRNNLHSLVKECHIAGTENNLKVAEIIRNQMIEQGLEDVHFNEYDVLLSYPNFTNPNIVEILSEDGETVYKTTGRSPSIIKEEQNDPNAEIQWFAYSADDVAEGDVVYVNTASQKDVEYVESLGIDLKGKIWLTRFGGGFRGNIASMAVKKGAIGCMVYHDPQTVAILGTGPNETFSKTDKMPPGAVQRGGVYIGMGDPRTPAFPSISNLYKEKTEEELSEEKLIPTIPILPIPYSAAQVIFEHMEGQEVIPKFRGKLEVTYRYGPGLVNKQKMRITVHAKNEERKIQNVLGFIKGHYEPEKFVLVGNHYDAWTYGAIDPNSGTAALLEMSRALMEYKNKTGWKPARSILFAHWDAEEYGLIGSTEFAEEYRVQLMRRAVAVVNTDLIGGNQTILGLANPTIAHVLREAAANTPHPNEFERSQGRNTIYDSWKHFSPSKSPRSTHPFMRIPAGGSDHLPFYNYLGVPIILFIANSIDAAPAYPLYHTIYETPFLVDKIIDPEYKFYRAFTQMLVEMTLKFSDSPVLPYDLGELLDDVKYDYLSRIEERLLLAEKSKNLTEYVAEGLKQFYLLKETVKEVSDVIAKRDVESFAKLPFIRQKALNERLMEFEKCFISPSGLLGSPQARHLLFNPSPDDWYNGNAISQVHVQINKLETSQDEKELKHYSRQLAKEIATVNVAFICAKHSLNDLIKPF